MSVSIWVLFPFHLLFFICLSALCLLLFLHFSPLLYSALHFFWGSTFTFWSFSIFLLVLTTHVLSLNFCHPHFFTCCSPFLFPLSFFFFFLSFVYLASSPLHLSCGPNSPITAGRNYAWKLIRRSLNNYPLMQLIDFPFQELCFLSPGSAFPLLELAFSFHLTVFGSFFGQVQVEFVGAKTPRK